MKNSICNIDKCSNMTIMWGFSYLNVLTYCIFSFIQSMLSYSVICWCGSLNQSSPVPLFKLRRQTVILNPKHRLFMYILHWTTTGTLKFYSTFFFRVSSEATPLCLQAVLSWWGLSWSARGGRRWPAISGDRDLELGAWLWGTTWSWRSAR